MSIVWSSAVGPAPRRLALLALANCLNEKTRRCDPSLKTIAGLVHVSRGQAQKLVRSLIGDGLVSVASNRLGGKPGTTPHYVLHLDRIAAWVETGITGDAGTDGADDAPTGIAQDAPPNVQTGITDAEDGHHARRETGITGDALTGIEPEKNQKRGRSASRRQEMTVVEWLDDLQAKGEKKIADDDPILDYLRKARIPIDFGVMHLRWFLDKHRESGRRQRDWRSFFRNSVKGNWGSLWYVDKATGEYQLTAAGVQAARAHDMPELVPNSSDERFRGAR